MEKLVGHARFDEILRQPHTLTDEELAELLTLINLAPYAHPQVQALVNLRMSLETIDSIRRFDKASAALVTTTNRLTQQIIYLTWVMVGIGILGAITSGWHPLTWWITHGFHFR